MTNEERFITLREWRDEAGRVHWEEVAEAVDVNAIRRVPCEHKNTGVGGNQEIGQNLYGPEWLIDRIIAAHNASDQTALDVALKALEEIGCVSISDTPCSDRTDGYEGCTRCQALTAIASKHPGSEQKGG